MSHSSLERGLRAVAFPDVARVGRGRRGRPHLKDPGGGGRRRGRGRPAAGQVHVLVGGRADARAAQAQAGREVRDGSQPAQAALQKALEQR